MGAWSFGPIDNDSAADWMGDTMQKSKLPRLIGKGLGSKNHNVMRAAAFLLEQVGYTYMYDIDVLNEHLALAIAKLEELLGNEGWIEEWSGPTELKKSIRKQIRSLKKRIKGEEAPGATSLGKVIGRKTK